MSLVNGVIADVHVLLVSPHISNTTMQVHKWNDIPIILTLNNV